MKIAVISDIHSNYCALKNVIREIGNYNIDFKICLGDMIGYYDEPNKVLDILRENNFICLKGNHEKFILGEIDFNLNNEEVYGVNRHRKCISSQNMEFIIEAKDYIEYIWNDVSICFSHSIKNNCQTYMRNKEEVHENLNEITKYDFFIYGHSHRRYLENINDTIIVNPGSVGQPRDDWRPSFAIIDLNSKSVEIKYTEYDIIDYVTRLNNMKYDKILTNILIRNL